MDVTMLVMYGGFALSAYSVVGNDTIQTLGTFLSSNEKRNWWILWLFAGTILSLTLIYGWYSHLGDVSYGRLTKYPLPETLSIYYLLPPIVLLFLTRSGIPVSTSFLILTFFNNENLLSMVSKSVLGYLVAFASAVGVYLLISKLFEKKFVENPITNREQRIWSVLQWVSTGFLWSQWLIQDFANIYVYFPRNLSLINMVISLLVILVMLAIIIFKRGGNIQSILKSKTNTVDLRSATIIDTVYGFILFYFKELNNVPMSTTWVFVGLLAGRELAMNYMLNRDAPRKQMYTLLVMDLGKIILGLVISIGLVFLVQYLISLA